MKKLALLLLFGLLGWAQTAVVVSPWPQFVSYTQSGIPNSFGCVFTYQSGTTTPLATYTDNTGVTQNANPVVLSGGGTANIWIQTGQAYTYAVYTQGGLNCASGSLLYTVNGIGGSGSFQTTTVTPVGGSATFTDTSQNTLFLMTLTGNVTSQPLTAVGVVSPGWITFQITQNASGGNTFAWPANVIGGCTIGSGVSQVTTQSFVWNGTSATAVGPCTTGTGPSVNVGSLTASGTVSANVLASTVATGTAPLQVTSTTLVPNLNVGSLLSGTWASPGAIGSSTPNTGAFTTLQIAGLGPLTGIQGTDVNVLSSATLSGATGSLLCTDANGGASTGCTPPPVFHSVVTATLGSSVPVSGSVQTTVLTQAVTMPAAGCPCRVLASYSMVMDNSAQSVATMWLSDGTNSFAATDWGINGANFHVNGLSAMDISPVTYANGANVTFTLYVEVNAPATVETTHNYGSAPAYLRLGIMSSN